jgi:hypothetical protein
MIVSEGEAMDKWCPHVRASSTCDDGNASNSSIDGTGRSPSYSLCIASECMAWRWDHDKNDQIETPVRMFGYCGLGGKP